MKLVDLLLSLLIPGLVLLHLLVAPYTKVEESFNIQASHDVLVYGTPTSNIDEKLRSTYDHFTFPGAVPRTFIGPVLLAGISQPIVALIGFEHAQFVVRAVLGLFNAACLLVLRRNLERAFGAPTARWFVLLQASQFHTIFYASRPLPNMFAFGLTTLAVSFLLPHPKPKAFNSRQRLAISFFVFAAVIFRAEIALLLATNALYLLVIPRISLEKLLPPFVISVLAALIMSVPVDSYFWQKPVWPELWGFYYNAILGSSSNWGVSPWHYYFTSALPRLLVNPLVPLLLIPLALIRPATARPARQLVYPSLLFAAIYSLQPHKEARFIFYVGPPLTAAAALGANSLFARRAKSRLSALAAAAVAASVALSFAASTAMLLLSALNYPGGDALAHLRSALLANPSAAVVPVHADVLARMTGVTLFGTAAAGGSGMPTLHGATGPVGSRADSSKSGRPAAATVAAAPSFALDTTEDPALLRDPAFWQQFDYVLAGDPADVKGGSWDVVGVVQGYGGVEVLRPGAAPDAAEEEGRGGAGKAAAAVVGRGALVAKVRDCVRGWTGGWWIGPRMVPRIRILKQVKGPEKGRTAVNE